MKTYDQVIYCDGTKDKNGITVSNIVDDWFDKESGFYHVKTVEGYHYISVNAMFLDYPQDSLDKMLDALHRSSDYKVWKNLPERIDAKHVIGFDVNTDPDHKSFIILLFWGFQGPGKEYNEILRCPFCGKFLRIAGQNRLETLDEHCCDPNGEVALKDTYKCENNTCKAYILNYCWNYYGEFYGSAYNHDTLDAPYGSYERKNQLKEIKQKKYSWRFINKYGMLDVKLFDRWKDKFIFEFTFWKKQENSGCCVHKSNGIVLPILQFFRGF